MNPTPRALLGILLAQGVVLCGEFLNMDFEQVPPPIPPSASFQPVETILPHWTARMGDHVLTEAGFLGQLDENGIVSILASAFAPVLEGRWGLFLSGGPEFGTTGPPVPASISQVGLIPAGAQSLLFRANIGAGSVTEFLINGVVQPVHLLGGTIGKRNWGIDISPFAGTESELRILNLPRTDGRIGGGYVDSLRFSSTIVPQPGAGWLIALGVGALLYRLQCPND